VTVFSAVALWLAYVANLITNHQPYVAGAIGLAAGWAICPGYMYLLAIVAEWRWPRYHDQFKAFMPGNLYLGVVFGGSCFLAASYRQAEGHGHLYENQLWLWLPLVASAAVVVALSAMDIIGAFRYKTGDTDKYHWLQLISPTKLWHNIVVYGAYGYLLVRVGVPGLLSAPWWGANGLVNDVVRVLLLGCLLRWVLFLKQDIAEPKFTTGHVRVNQPQFLIGLFMIGSVFVILNTFI